MRFNDRTLRLYRLRLPLWGMGLFVIFYCVAALLYPGGSWVNTEQIGFSFLHNYLCDLLDDNAVNGSVNTGRFYARLALALLCVSLIYLWYHLRKLFPKTSVNRTVMWFTGQIALVTTFFLASNTHDEVVRLAGVFGIVAVLTLSIELFKARYYLLTAIGLECVVVFVFNYYCYETGFFLNLLPLVQKITFLSFMLWFVLLDLKLYRIMNVKA